MSEYFQAKVSSLQQMSNGLIAKVVETYLIDAMSFTEAEARAIKESEGSREVQAVAISRSPIKEVVFYGDTDLWHKVKVCYSLMDEETEKEKKVTTYFLVNANDVKEAYERTEEHLKEMLVPFQIPKVEESQICEVFQYEKQAPQGFVKQVSAFDTVDELSAAVDGALRGDMSLTKAALNRSIEREAEEECAMETNSIEAIDPTDGQAIGFEMDLRAYLMQIRPHDWVKLTTEIEKVWNENPEGTRWALGMNCLTDEQQDHVMNILLTERSFEQDEEDDETDLEGRFGLAMKGGGDVG